jgi:hypothetical protein
MQQSTLVVPDLPHWGCSAPWRLANLPIVIENPGYTASTKWKDDRCSRRGVDKVLLRSGSGKSDIRLTKGSATFHIRKVIGDKAGFPTRSAEG